MQWKNKAAAQAAAAPLPPPPPLHLQLHPGWGGGTLPASWRGWGLGGGWPVLGQGRKCVKFYKMMNVTQGWSPSRPHQSRRHSAPRLLTGKSNFHIFQKTLHLHSPSESLTQSEVRWCSVTHWAGAREYWDTPHTEAEDRMLLATTLNSRLSIIAKSKHL